MFQFPQNGYEGIDLPRGIGCGERKIYILAKGYVFAKREVKSGIAFPLTDWRCNAVFLLIMTYLREKLYFKTVFLN